MNSPPSRNGERTLLEKALPNVPRGTLEIFLRYIDLIFQWNQKINLTGAKSRQDFLENHLLDCAEAWAAIPHDAVMMDVGTGAGLPGLVWAILSPSTEFFLLDASHKRTAFLQRVSSELQLQNVTVITDRFERLSDLPKVAVGETVDLVSRGTANPTDLLHLASRSQRGWRYWYVFSNEKIHAEYLTAAPQFEIEVEKIFYPSVSDQTEAERPGILTRIKRIFDHTLHEM